MEALLLVAVLGATVLVGTTIGGRYSVAPPVLLIVGGALLALIPRLSHVTLPPELVLLLFLPPILYYESLNISLREIRANLGIILLQAVVLVIATMVAISFALQAVGVPSDAAWVLGAVLAPTDAAAVAGLAKRMPRRTLTRLRAESLINDGTALVLFAVAVGAVGGESTPGPPLLAGEFVWSFVGGVLSGLGTGRVVVLIRRHVDDPLREGGLSMLTPFVAFLLGELVHASGVVAVVVSGLVLSYASPRVIRARSRFWAFAFWDLSTFMINGSLFVLVGMQIPRAVRDIDGRTLGHALLVAFTASAVAILLRLSWVHVSAWVIRLVDRREAQRARRVDWRVRTAEGWAGFRGAVSLAAALAVPATLANGTPYGDRDLIVFTTVTVIVVTILLQGLTLPYVLRWAGLEGDEAREDETQRASLKATQAALDALPDIARTLDVPPELEDRVRADYEEHLEELRSEGEEEQQAVHYERVEHRLRLAILQRKRQTITALRDANKIDDYVLRDLQAGMDIEEIRLLGPTPLE
ncbi:Na+/H+ antiporter [Phytohabitans sp. ZYX-F-186]|uniref:Na+/H+ antiporter n=1 Tax=Phytohabitans maris TaxID=3071409 RepID=A0ABU0ZNT7_9ACTN|nr:Na+/H+ antiporter [Phytohabitans sp. ZYX-F-186]MDQ7908072.1 Na+/H+ antiporter [Phytohabitans sp. ZYX-F-186]